LFQRAWSTLILIVCAVILLSVPAFRELAGFHFGRVTMGSPESNGGNEVGCWPLAFGLPSASPEQFRRLAEAVGNDPMLWQAAAEKARSLQDTVDLYDRALALAPQEVSLFTGQIIASLRYLSLTSEEEEQIAYSRLESPLLNRNLTVRKLLDRLAVARRLDPDNAFLDYLLAYFQAGTWSAAREILPQAGHKPHFETYRREVTKALAKAYRQLGYPELESQCLALSETMRTELGRLRSLARIMTRWAQVRSHWEPQGEVFLEKADGSLQRIREPSGHEMALEQYESILRLGAYLCRSDSELDLLAGVAIQTLALSGPSEQPVPPQSDLRVPTHQMLKAFQAYARKHGRADLAAWAEREVGRNLERREQVQQALRSGYLFGPSVDPYFIRVAVGDLAARVAALGLAGLLLMGLVAALPWGKEEAPGLPWRSWHWLALWGPMVLLPFGLLIGMGWRMSPEWRSVSPEPSLRAILLALTLFLLLAFEIGVGVRLLRARRTREVTGAIAGRTFGAAARPTCALLAVLYLGTLAFTVRARQDASTVLGQWIQREIPTLLGNGEREP